MPIGIKKSREEDPSSANEYWNDNYKTFVKYQIKNLQKRMGTESVDFLIGKPKITEGKKIKGTLAYAGVSLNNRLYLFSLLS